jgi:hypothetical protein
VSERHYLTTALWCACYNFPGVVFEVTGESMMQISSNGRLHADLSSVISLGSGPDSLFSE